MFSGANAINSLSFQFEGEWKKLNELFKYLGGGTFNRGIKRDIAKSQRDFLTKMKRNLVAGLSSGGSAINASFAAHSSGYSSGGSVVGVNRGHYLNALSNARIIQKGYITTLNLSKGSASFTPTPGGLTVMQYAKVFEFGSPNRPYPQPGRYLWTHTYKYMGGNAKVLQGMTGAIGKRLSKMGIRIRTK